MTSSFRPDWTILPVAFCEYPEMDRTDTTRRHNVIRFMKETINYLRSYGKLLLLLTGVFLTQGHLYNLEGQN